MARGSKRLSKMAANRLAVTTTVTSSASVHGAELAEALHKALFPSGREKVEITSKFLSALSSYLDRCAGVMQEADLAHSAELLDDEEPRQRRDGTLAALSETLLSQRDTVQGAFGAQVVRATGLDEALPSNPQQLLQRARAVAGQLRENGLPARALRPGTVVKAAALADELEGLVAKLAEALGDVQRETREAQLTLERKNLAATGWQDAYQAVSSSFYGLYLLAGRRDLADRIEPTARRRAGLPEEPDAPGNNNPAPSPPPAP